MRQVWQEMTSRIISWNRFMTNLNPINHHVSDLRRRISDARSHHGPTIFTQTTSLAMEPWSNNVPTVFRRQVDYSRLSVSTETVNGGGTGGAGRGAPHSIDAKLLNWCQLTWNPAWFEIIIMSHVLLREGEWWFCYISWWCRSLWLGDELCFKTGMTSL